MHFCYGIKSADRDKLFLQMCVVFSDLKKVRMYALPTSFIDQLPLF